MVVTGRGRGFCGTSKTLHGPAWATACNRVLKLQQDKGRTWVKDVGKQFAANLQLMNTTTETSKFKAESSIVCNGESVVGLGITADQLYPAPYNESVAVLLEERAHRTDTLRK